MLTNVFTKSTRDRLSVGLFGALGVGVLLFFSIWVYGDVDTSFYYDLPSGVLQLVGINPGGSGVGGIAFGAIYNLMGALTLGGLAISWGASAIAGEEQRGTFGFLLGNPLSRRGVLTSKATSMALVVGLMTLILWVIGVAGAAALDTPTDDLFIGPMTLALFLSSLFYGFLALAVGSWTGKRGLASGVAAVVMIVGYLAASLLPIANLEWLARLFPWYYYSSGAPLNNGLDWAHVAVLAALSLASLIFAYVGIERRDLKEKGTDVTLFDRLRANPRTRKAMERVAGSGRVSRISMKTFSEFQSLFVITAAIMLYMGVLIPPLYNFIPEEFISIFSTFPDALIAMIGGVDMGTPTGFLTGEVFSLVGPIAIIVLAATMGARSIAGEEEKHTMGILLTNPITRSHVILEKVQAMVLYSVLFGVVTFGATWAGVTLGGLNEVSVAGIASISLLLTLFGLVFGAVALLISAATGRRGVATMATTGVAIVTWFMFSFFPLSDTFEPFSSISPFQWYLGSDPLLNGMDWLSAALLAGTFVTLVLVSMPLFQRRDLRG
jgi:beta-exotoxin I transport system permease protein